MTFSEDDFIGWVTRGGQGDLQVGPGDDAAVLADGTVVSVDGFVEGTHFLPGTPMDLLARKALGAAISDLCAMGAVPETVFVCALLPPACDGRALADGLLAWSERFGVVLAGGDTDRAPAGALALAVTATGHCRGGAPWLRSGAVPGDRLVVSGPLGGAGSGRHLHVQPRVDVVARLRAARIDVHAAIDLSDGLGRDLPRMCEASRAGARVQAAALPVHTDVGRERDSVMAVLGDGEDFELLLAVSPQTQLPSDLIVIGTVQADRHVVLERQGRAESWPACGYVHEF